MFMRRLGLLSVLVAITSNSVLAGPSVGHQFTVAYDFVRIDKEGFEKSSLFSDSYNDTIADFLRPSTLGYSYFPSVFFGLETSYSKAQSQFTDGETMTTVKIKSYKLGGIIRQPWNWLLPYAKAGINYFETNERVDSHSDRSDWSVNNYYGVRPYFGLGASVYIPIFNTGHEFELGAEYSFQPYSHGYSINSISTSFQYHF